MGGLLFFRSADVFIATKLNAESLIQNGSRTKSDRRSSVSQVVLIIRLNGNGFLNLVIEIWAIGSVFIAHFSDTNIGVFLCQTTRITESV